MEDELRVTICLGWRGKIPHTHTVSKYHSYISNIYLQSLGFYGHPEYKLAVKYDIIKSSQFFNCEEPMNYSEATTGNIFPLYLAASILIA